jgi:pimeloyl-ACP methyl ester carboxylesterase
MAHATIDGREIHYVQQGDGEPLLLIQGMSGSHLSWGDPFLGELGRDFAVTAYDHRGIGRSSRVENEPFTIGDLAEDAAALLDAIGVDRAHVLGISMGGMVAQELALRHPDRLRTLALGCTYSGGAGAMLTRPEVFGRLSEAMMSGDRERALRAGYDVNVSAAFAAEDEHWAAFRTMATQLPAPVPVIMAQVQAIGGHDVQDRLGEIAAPTLVIHGDEDQMLDVANGRLIASRIPGARLEVLEGVGHMFWWERPQESAELIRAHALAAAGG